MSETTSAISEVTNAGWDPRLRIIRVGKEVDISVLVTTRYVIFVDTAATPDQAAAIVELVRPALATRQPLVINTHADYDHAWGNAAFLPGGICPAPIIGHRLTRERLLGAEARAYLAQRQREDARFAGVRLVPPAIAFDGDLIIDGGDLTLHLLHAPGHAEDHVAAWLPEIRMLLAGDAAEHPFPYVGDHAVLPVLRRSLERLRTLDPAVVVPCHGGTTDPDLLRRNLAYFDRLEEALGTMLAAGRLAADWREREDIDVAVGLPFEQILQEMDIDPAGVSDFYRTAHRRAIRATLVELFAGSGA
jgi:glyoxylase-like metal-dependent hydrolase (beta-lactamase superfamily II)